MNKIILFSIFTLFTSLLQAQNKTNENPFIHPGMIQNKSDLDLMKKNISENKEPWKTAFENLKNNTDPNFLPKPFTHVSSGAYGANDIGGNEFSRCGKAAYNNALLWYITNDKSYANKAIEILNVWSYKLWDFDGNNAKLLIGLFSPDYLNAAEILRYTDSGWKEKDMEQFSRLVLGVLYPTIKDFFSEANGNWDASMIYAMMCMGVYLDNHEMFNKAVDQFYYGKGNAGIVKYIYPTGQCQETIRDWDHVQLGLGELAKAAQVAWTQGLDFYSVADCRLALGIEYATKYLTGNGISVFGSVSERENDKFRDIYESVYEHYEKVKGIAIPFTGELIKRKTRTHSSIGILSSLRVPEWAIKIDNKRPLSINAKAKLPTICGALESKTIEIPLNHIYIAPGKSIQKEIDKLSKTDTPKWIVLGEGIHVLKETLKLKSNITLCGEGKKTILVLEKNVEGTTIMNDSEPIQNVTIRDLLIEGATEITNPMDPNHERNQRLYNAKSRGGISLIGEEDQIQNILIENITIQNCTRSGILISGARNITIANCDVSDNGSSVVPGSGFHHNISLTHISESNIKGCRADASLWGNGLNIINGNKVRVSDNEFARNKLSGIAFYDSHDIQILNNLIEGNSEYGILSECLSRDSIKIKIEDNLIQLNSKEGILVKYSLSLFPKNNLRDNKVSVGLSINHSMHPEKQIEFVRLQIKQKKEPYYSAYKQLIYYADSVYTQNHHALVNLSIPGYYIKPDEHRKNSLAIQSDAFGAYCSALAYRLSDDKKYGEKAIYFLNAWSMVNKGYSEHDGVLVMTYSGSGLLMGAELMAETNIWDQADKAAFAKWVSLVYKKAANEIRVHKNNWADWGRFGSLLAASLLNDQEEITENVSLMKSDLFEKIAPDGSIPEEVRRGDNGIWYTYFSLAPMTASAWIVYNLTGEDLFHQEKDKRSIKKALDYLLYYEQHPDEWAWFKNPRTGKNEMWPENLFEAMAGIYNNKDYTEFAKKYRPIIYSSHHYAWVFPTLMPISLE